MSTRITKFPALVALMACVAAGPASAQSRFEVVHTFSGSKGQPVGAPAQGLDGRLYGATVAGGSLGKGSIYATDPTGNTTTIHEFTGEDGEAPRGSLMRASDGAIYGTTSQSAGGAGTVFRITKEGLFELLVHFNGLNGASPEGGLVETGGSFYGTTRFGGATGNGSIFKMTPSGSGWLMETLVSFNGVTNGGFPTGSLIQAEDGSLYGSTQSGSGTLFRVSLDGTLETLVSFDGANGANPSDGPIQATDGNFYGTTEAGGVAALGTIYRLASDASGALQLETLHAFSGADGARPMGALRQLGDGRIYGTTQEGGNGSIGWGTVFRLTLAIDGSASFASIASFDDENGAFPASGLIQAESGAIYGTTIAGGPGTYGTVFELLPEGAIRTAATFSGTAGADPDGRLIAAGDGNFFGTTLTGGRHGFGTVFRMTAEGNVTTIASFNGLNGASPSGALLLASDGALYGTTSGGGATNDGTIFRVTHDGTFESLDSFTFDLSGAAPIGGLIEGSDGQLYGTTQFGGEGAGTIFKFNREDRLLSAAAVFPAGEFFKMPQGGNPSAGVIEAPDGSFYGTAEVGGEKGLGTIFRLSATGLEAAFSFHDVDGSYPASPLFLGSDGQLYGTTSGGGDTGNGTLFRMALGGALETLASFSGLDGAYPYRQGVIEIEEGVFAGSTMYGGADDRGTVYEWSVESGITTLHGFDGLTVDSPNTTLTADGALYGTAIGPYGGVIYRVIRNNDTTPPVLLLPGNLVVNATAPNGATVNYVVTATDDSGDPVTISCSRESGSVFRIGTTAVICTATDASGNVSEGRFTVKVLGAAAQIANLIEKIRRMPLPATIKTALISILDKALSDPRGAAFVCDLLRSLIGAAKLMCPAPLAAEIIADATRIRAVIGCV